MFWNKTGNSFKNLMSFSYGEHNAVTDVKDLNKQQ